MSMHAEWLSLIEISGAFLAEPILDQAFPQGLEGLETSKKQAFRQTYEEWREALDTGDELQAKLQQEWINWVLKKADQPEQFVLFSEDERTQVRRDLDALNARLSRIPEEREHEVHAIEHRYADYVARTFPVAVIFLVPQSMMGGAQ